MATNIKQLSGHHGDFKAKIWTMRLNTAKIERAQAFYIGRGLVREGYFPTEAVLNSISHQNTPFVPRTIRTISC